MVNDNLEAQASAIYHSMFDEQNEWLKGSVSDFGEVVGGATPSKDIDEYFCSDGIVWLTPKDLTSTGKKFIYKGETDITEAAYCSCSTCSFNFKSPCRMCGYCYDRSLH